MKLKVKVAIVLNADEARRMHTLAMSEHRRQRERLPVEETRQNDDMMEEYSRMVDKACEMQQGVSLP